MMTIAMRLLTSRLGLALIIAVMAFGWHTYDKAQAVRAATTDYVRRVEYIALKAEHDALTARLARTTLANKKLAEDIATAEAENEDAEARIQTYLEGSTGRPTCAVDPRLFDLLRAR